MRPPRSTDRLESAFEALLTQHTANIRRRIAARILPQIPDLVAARADALVNVGGLSIDIGDVSLTPGFEQQLFDFGERTVKHATRAAADQLEDLAKGRQRTRLRQMGLRSIEPWMLKQAQRWATVNAELIRNVPDWYALQVSNLVTRGLDAGVRAEDLEAQLRQFLEAPPSRIALIARDQVGKLQSDIIAGRQKELGITAYYWGTASDRRVVGRPGGLYPNGSRLHQNHWERRNRLFDSEALPLVELVGEARRRVIHSNWTDGHPGEPIQCRCYRIPDLSGV